MKPMAEGPMSRTQKLSLTALLAAMALGIFILEAQLPAPVPIPGVKLGLANSITLTAMLLLGRKEAGCVLLVRILLGALFAGSPSTLLFSAAGGVLAYLGMCLLTVFIPEKRLWVTSAISAVLHNAGQLLVSVLVVKTPGLWAYAPILAVSGVITGVFTGLAAQYLVLALRRWKR